MRWEAPQSFQGGDIMAVYAILGGISAHFGLCTGLGATTLLRPLLDAVSSLPPRSVSLLCTMATLGAALVSAFFALSRPLPLHQDELILLAVGGALGGFLGDLASNRFLSVLTPEAAMLLQNALLFTLVALPAIYFRTLSQSVRPLSLTRLGSLPVSLLAGLAASFLSFGSEPLTLLAYYLLFDAEDDESAAAALTVALFAMAGKLITQLVRLRLNLPDADALLWLLPGTLIGAAAAMFPAFQGKLPRKGDMLLKMSLFTSLVNIAAALV